MLYSTFLILSDVLRVDIWKNSNFYFIFTKFLLKSLELKNFRTNKPINSFDLFPTVNFIISRTIKIRFYNMVHLMANAGILATTKI